MSKKENHVNETKEMNFSPSPYFVPYMFCPYECFRQQPFEPVSEVDAQMEPTLKDIGYTQAYLRTQIGKKVKIDFLIGTDLFIDKEGILLEVGISYVVIRELSTNFKVMCDLYSIKFVSIYE
ncbi:hypothetical protein SAMN05660865_00534 [Caloramator fervidus]|uniref:Uncharacterized protein n=1 Tax=Caloramator fervidus TaxID=29344 RepID=A0A1H5T223_9CLOT|nr:hypothetical protein SAMN05660865_00534 [Caloramator fervidus]